VVCACVATFAAVTTRAIVDISESLRSNVSSLQRTSTSVVQQTMRSSGSGFKLLTLAERDTVEASLVTAVLALAAGGHG
jgi:hypothetical protein